MSERITLTFAGDESGDVSFSFGKDASHYFVRRISVRRSKSESLIQVADLIAGSILRRDTHNETGAFERIAGKIVRIIEYKG